MNNVVAYTSVRSCIRKHLNKKKKISINKRKWRKKEKIEVSTFFSFLHVQRLFQRIFHKLLLAFHRFFLIMRFPVACFSRVLIGSNSRIIRYTSKGTSYNRNFVGFDFDVTKPLKKVTQPQRQRDDSGLRCTIAHQEWMIKWSRLWETYRLFSMFDMSLYPFIFETWILYVIRNFN